MAEKDFSNKSGIAKKRKYFALADLIVVSIVIIIAFFGFFRLFAKSTGRELVAVIRVGGNVYEEIPLSAVEKEYDLVVEGYDLEKLTLHITSSSVEFVDSSCPDKLCVNTGKLTDAGDSAVCLPHRVSVKLVESEGAQSMETPDAIVG